MICREGCWFALLLKPEKLLMDASWSVWVLLGAHVEHESFFYTLSLFSPPREFLSPELGGPLFEWLEEKNRASIITLLCVSGRFLLPLLRGCDSGSSLGYSNDKI